MLKVAIVHDWLVTVRGGEKVLDVLCELFPEATLFTLIYRSGRYTESIDRMRKVQSFLQHIPFATTRHQHFLPLYPLAARSLNLAGYDLILSSSHAAAKAVRVPSGALHLCYCHTPMRYIWDQFDHYFGPGRASFPIRLGMGLVRPYLQRWDVESADGVDRFIANSAFVRDRIRRIYRRDATVLYPPVDTTLFQESPATEGYYLVLSSLVPYKRIDVAVDAMTKLNRPLVVAGSGSEERRLKARAGNTISFRGYISQDEVRKCYQGCRALLFPGEEDFGIAPVEAMACGKPVIAYGSGGACETVIDGVTGMHFPMQSAASLIAAVELFERKSFDAGVIRQHALRFDRSLFKTGMQALIKETLEQGGRKFREPFR